MENENVVTVETVEVETVPVERTEVEIPVKEKKSVKQRWTEFTDRHPVAVRRAKKIGKGVLIVGAAVGGALYGFSKMAEKSGYGSDDVDLPEEDTIEYEGSDLDSSDSEVE